MCAPWGRGFCVDLFRNVVVMWVALELSGTYAVNGVFCFRSPVESCILEKMAEYLLLYASCDLHAQMYLIQFLAEQSH